MNTNKETQEARPTFAPEFRDTRTEAECVRLQALTYRNIGRIIGTSGAVSTKNLGKMREGTLEKFRNVLGHTGFTFPSGLTIERGGPRKFNKIFTENERQYYDSPFEERTKDARLDVQARALQATISPEELKRRMLKDAQQTLELVNVHFQDAVDSEWTGRLDFDIKRAKWAQNISSVKDIEKELKGRTEEELEERGIRIRPRNAFVTFTDRQLRLLAEAFLPYILRNELRPVFAEGNVGEVNVQCAMMLAEQHPAIVGKMRGDVEHAKEETKTAERKKQLAELIFNELKKFPAKSLTEDYNVAAAELKEINNDLKNTEKLGPPPYKFKSKYFVDRLKLKDAAVLGGMPVADRDRKLDQADSEKKRLGDVCEHYLPLEILLGRIHSAIRRVDGFTIPASFQALFKGTSNVVNRKQLTTSINPGAIADALEADLSLGTVDEYKTALAKAKSHKEAAEGKEPKGREAVIEMYKEYFIRENKSGTSEAYKAAYYTYWQNEMGQNQNKDLEKAVMEKCGGQLIWFTGAIQGVKATLKGLFTGSPESMICAVAESQGVQIPTGSGHGGAAPAWLGENRLVRAMFGNKRFGLLWRKFRARPAWGMIKSSEKKIGLAYFAIRELIRKGQLENTWYVQGQLTELARLRMPSVLRRFASTMAKSKMKEDAHHAEKGADKEHKAKGPKLEDAQETMTSMVHEMVHGEIPRDLEGDVALILKEVVGDKETSGKVGWIRKSIPGVIAKTWTGLTSWLGGKG